MYTEDPQKFYNNLNKKLPLLGIDPGTKNIGLAISDVSKTIATPLDVLTNVKYKNLVNYIKNIQHRNGLSGIVIGYPVNMDGTVGPKAQSSNSLADNLFKDINLPILLWDERLSTSAVEKMLINADITRDKRKKNIDKLAASYILQGFLDLILKIEEQ
tara:strand:+ start:8994 stop:9467 length:474 start_codon:yes stop_codon:yes gene_type:complete